jgi:hypothetical protein
MSKFTSALLAVVLGAIVGAVAGAFAFIGPVLIEPSFILIWGWVMFFVGPAVAGIVWLAATRAFYPRLSRGSVTPWVVTGVSLLPVIGVWLTVGEELTGVTTRRWTEDVQLADGSTVRVDRYTRTDHWHDGKLDASMRFTSELSALPEWRGPFIPLVLYRDERSGEWVIVATTSSCELLLQQGPPRYLFTPDKPATQYLEFRARNERWTQTPLYAASIGRRANLVTLFKEVATSHVTVEARERLQREVGLDYQTVTEQPQGGCMHSTGTQAFWDAQDRVLAALDRENATPEQRARVEELIVAGPASESIYRRLTAAGFEQFAQ